MKTLLVVFSVTSWAAALVVLHVSTWEGCVSGSRGGKLGIALGCVLLAVAPGLVAWRRVAADAGERVVRQVAIAGSGIAGLLAVLLAVPVYFLAPCPDPRVTL